MLKVLVPSELSNLLRIHLIRCCIWVNIGLLCLFGEIFDVVFLLSVEDSSSLMEIEFMIFPSSKMLIQFLLFLLLWLLSLDNFALTYFSKISLAIFSWYRLISAFFFSSLNLSSCIDSLSTILLITILPLWSSSNFMHRFYFYFFLESIFKLLKVVFWFFFL